MKKFTFLALLLGTFLTGTKSNAQIDPYLGQIILVPYNFAPVGWARCDGQDVMGNYCQLLKTQRCFLY